MKFLTLLGLALFGFGNSLNCGEGQVADSNQLCIKPRYIEGCYQYSTKTSCQQCQYNYKLRDDGLCEYQTNNTQQCCLEYNRQKQCTKCNRGLYLIQNQCKQSKILGCLERNSSGKCINCSSDFILQNGICLNGIRNCQKYLDNKRQVCIQCKPNHSLITNNCLHNKILGCKKQINQLCQQCFAPFLLNSGHCQISNCKAYNDYGCTACNCGYYITDGRICNQMIPGCLRYQRGYCTDCLPNFKLKGNICAIDGCQETQAYQCKKCKAAYELKDGACIMKNCTQWNNEKCEICAKGYFYNNGNCIKAQTKEISSTTSS